MSTRVPSTAKPTSAPARPAPARHRFRPFRLAILLLILGLVSLAEPRVFHFVVRHLVAAEAWRSGGHAHVGSVEGSIFEPFTLVGSVWSFRSRTGAVTRVEIARATVALEWTNLVRRTSHRWFQRLSLDGVTGKIELPTEATPAPEKPLVDLDALRTRWRTAPALTEAREVDLTFACDDDFVRLQHARFSLSELEPGVIKIGRVVVQQSWLRKTFPNIRGTTALKDSQILLANLAIEPGVEVKNFSAELAELAKGSLQLKAQLAVFGGEIHAQAQTEPQDHQLNFEASGTFSKINIGRLAAFLALSDAAGGTIKDGNFSFRGSPQNVTKSTTRLRLDATDFQWETRQWDSLVLGAELIDRRLQLHDFRLHQGHNDLTLSGEFTLPEPGRKWWQSDFNCNILAKIDNLTELSALLLPEFKYAAGRVNIDGQVRGRDEKFEGKLDVNGSGLQWRNAPIDELHATLRLHENELRVSNLTIFNDVDSVRGSGVVNILGPTQYWGTLRGSVEDLAKYAAILQKPVVPESIGGGAIIDWSGEGSAKGHSGKFTARLKKLRSLGASAALLHPLNAELDGNYAAGSMVFSRFVLADDDSSFTANVAVGNKALSVQGIKLRQKQQLALEGDALLPLDVWKAWPNTSLDTLLDDEVQSRVALTAYGLDLADAATLTGWIFPIEGVVRGTLTAEGPLGALKTGGKLTLTKARLPIARTGLALTGVEGEVTFDAQTMTLVKLTGTHPTGDFRASGTVVLKNLRDPALALTFQSDRSDIPLFRANTYDRWTDRVEARAALELVIEGPTSAALVRGAATGVSFSFGTPGLHVNNWDDALWDEHLIALAPMFFIAAPPVSAWRFDIACAGTGITALRLTGTAAKPRLDGAVEVQTITDDTGPRAFLAVNRTPTTAAHLAIHFTGDAPQNPSIALTATGHIDGKPWLAFAAGPLSHLVRGFHFPPSLTEAAIRDALAGSRTHAALDTPVRFALRIPSPLDTGVEVFDWSISDAPTPGVQ